MWTLNLMGVSVPIGLAATLLFRGLSFWLPMLPGWWVSRRITASTVAATLPEGPPKDYWSADADTLRAATRLDAGRPVCRRRGGTAARVRTEPGARAPAPHADAGPDQSAPEPAAAGLALRRCGIGDDRRVGRCRHRRRDRARDRRYRIRARVPGRDGRGGPAGARAHTSPRPSRRACGRCARWKRSCLATSCCSSAGSLVPADGVILEATDFFVSEAVLTGESFPVEKRPGAVAATRGRARPTELRLPRHQRAQRHRALPDRRDRLAHAVRRASRTV